MSRRLNGIAVGFAPPVASTILKPHGTIANVGIMRIVIIGAGLGGLTAACCFAGRGHQVLVLERRAALVSTGGGISIRPGARKLFESWGLGDAIGKICQSSSSVIYRNLTSGDIRKRVVDDAEFSDWGTIRGALLKLLCKLATARGVKLRFGAVVASLSEDETAATVMLEDKEEQYRADIVLAADGINSQIRSLALSDLGPAENWRPIISDSTIYSVLVPATNLPLLTANTDVMVWTGKSGYAISRYSPSNGTVGSGKVAIFFGIKGETNQSSLWDLEGDTNYVRDILADSCEDIRRVFEATGRCSRWKVAELPNVPRWHSKGCRIVLLGDSAHAMHPNAAHGFSSIVEDIGVLDHLISRQDLFQDIPRIVEIWQHVRKPRVEKIKAYSKWNTENFTKEHFLHAASVGQTTGAVVKPIGSDSEAQFNTPEFWKWATEYDAISEVCHRVGNERWMDVTDCHDRLTST